MEAISKQDYTDAAGAGAAGRRGRRAEQRARFVPRRSTCASPACRPRSAAASAGPLSPKARWSPPTRPIRWPRSPGSTRSMSTSRNRPRTCSRCAGALDNGGAVPTSAQVRLKLADGSDYGFTGTVEFAEMIVDPSTGTVTLARALPQSAGVLLPGMFVKAEFAQAVDTTAFLVPQQAVSRESQGNATCSSSGRATGPCGARSSPTAPRRQLGRDRRLEPGDKVITKGLRTSRTARRSSRCRRARRRRVKAPAAGGIEGEASEARRLAHVADFHRSADLRLGPRDRHHARWASARSSRCRSSNIRTSRRPQINIRASYPGASAETIENSVTQMIEQQLTGHRRPALFQLDIELARIGVDLGDLRQGHGSRHRAGPGPEQGAAGDLAPAAASAAAGRDGNQGLAGLPADRRRLRRDRQAHQRGRVRLAAVQHAGPAVARSPASATSMCSARHTRCASGSTRNKLAELPAHAERRGHRDPEPEH